VVATPPTASTADPKTQADDFYAQRADVMKVRQALIVLRQADTANPSDYEIVWRLARANYYLGTHSPDDTETEKAFRDGIDAGNDAVCPSRDQIGQRRIGPCDIGAIEFRERDDCQHREQDDDHQPDADPAAQASQ